MSKHERKKSDIDFKNLAVSAITDLLVGIILLILDRILNH